MCVFTILLLVSILKTLPTGQCQFGVNASHWNKINAKCCHIMSIKKFLNLAKVEKALNDHDFRSDLEESGSPINIVEFPRDTVDSVTDEDDIDENN